MRAMQNTEVSGTRDGAPPPGDTALVRLSDPDLQVDLNAPGLVIERLSDGTVVLDFVKLARWLDERGARLIVGPTGRALDGLQNDFRRILRDRHPGTRWTPQTTA
jgi:hypothetical protein